MHSEKKFVYDLVQLSLIRESEKFVWFSLTGETPKGRKYKYMGAFSSLDMADFYAKEFALAVDIMIDLKEEMSAISALFQPQMESACDRKQKGRSTAR